MHTSPAEQAVQRHVPAVLGQQVGPQLARAQQQDAHAAFQRAVHPPPFCVVHRPGVAAEHVLFVGCQVVPEGKTLWPDNRGVPLLFPTLLFHPFRRALAASVPACAPSYTAFATCRRPPVQSPAALQAGHGGLHFSSTTMRFPPPLRRIFLASAVLPATPSATNTPLTGSCRAAGQLHAGDNGFAQNSLHGLRIW